MLTYKAMYKFLDQGVHAEVLDFPGTITFGVTLEEARRLLASAAATLSCRISSEGGRYSALPIFSTCPAKSKS